MSFRPQMSSPGLGHFIAIPGLSVNIKVIILIKVGI